MRAIYGTGGTALPGSYNRAYRISQCLDLRYCLLLNRRDAKAQRTRKEKTAMGRLAGLVDCNSRFGSTLTPALSRKGRGSVLRLSLLESTRNATG